MSVGRENLDQHEKLLHSLNLDCSVRRPGPLFRGGYAAGRVLDGFPENNLASYSDNRDQPQTDEASHMSKYLHYVQISSAEAALAILDSGGPQGLRAPTWRI